MSWSNDEPYELTYYFSFVRYWFVIILSWMMLTFALWTYYEIRLVNIYYKKIIFKSLRNKLAQFSIHNSYL